MLGFLSICIAVVIDKWLVEEHLTARMGGILERNACRKPFLFNPVSKHDKVQHKNLKDGMYTKHREIVSDVRSGSVVRNEASHKNRMLQILNKPVATLAGFKGLWRESLGVEMVESAISSGKKIKRFR